MEAPLEAGTRRQHKPTPAPRPRIRGRRSTPATRSRAATYHSTDSFYYALRAAIDTAQDSIELAYYVVSHRPRRPTNPAWVLFQHITDAAARCCSTRLILPAFNHVKSNLPTALYLQHLGVTVRTMPPHIPLHLKFALIDRRVLFVGSHNLCRKSFERNVEATVEIYDPASLIQAARDFRGWWATSRPVEMEAP